MASVLARRASTPSRTELAIIKAAKSAARRGTKRKCGPIGQKNGTDRAQERGQTIEPDGRPRLRHAERLSGFHRGRLQPIDSNRLFVSDLILKPDIDVVSSISSICFVAWAKRASSRSTGGIWKKPGRNASNENTTSSTTARRCDAMAKSSAAIRLRRKPIWEFASPVVVLTLSITLTVKFAAQ